MSIEFQRLRDAAKADRFFSWVLVILTVAVVGLALLTFKGCGAATWQTPPFELRKIERNGEPIKAWVADCPIYLIETDDQNVSGFDVPPTAKLVTQRCCPEGEPDKCVELPVFLMVAK